MTSLSSLPLFSRLVLADAERELAVPDIRTPVPVAPGSASSEAGAKLVDPFRGGMYRKIMLELASVDRPLSREELSARTGIKESTLCGRLSTRELRPDWVEAVPNVCTSSAGVRVDGYVLSERGRARVRGAA